MRHLVLSRSVVAIATVALGSAVLAAVPASAATAADITRAEVLNAAKLVRINGGSIGGEPTEDASATNRAVRVLANRACGIDPDDEVAIFGYGLAVEPGQSADGLMVVSQIIDLNTLSTANGRVCVFGTLAAPKSSTTLSGTAKLTTDTEQSYKLSGDVFVTPARSFTVGSSGTEEPPFDLEDLGFSATGTATTLTKVTTTKTVKTPKSKAQKKSAKTKYDQALSAANKAYKKALKKAGTSKSKKATAKEAYAKKKAAAKTAYKKRIATSKVVKVVTVAKTPAPFDVQATPGLPIPE